MKDVFPGNSEGFADGGQESLHRTSTIEKQTPAKLEPLTHSAAAINPESESLPAMRWLSFEHPDVDRCTTGSHG
jgi:hypothetical protein